jgi:hypothetical protein
MTAEQASPGPGAEVPRSGLVWTLVRGERVRVRPSSEELVEEIRRQFFKVGMAYTLLTKRDISAATWIHTARKVAHDLGRPVHTLQDGVEVRAWLKDWPRDDREAEIHRRRVAGHAAATASPRSPTAPDHPRGASAPTSGA